jgi:hypothetical protein
MTKGRLEAFCDGADLWTFFRMPEASSANRKFRYFRIAGHPGVTNQRANGSAFVQRGMERGRTLLGRILPFRRGFSRHRGLSPRCLVASVNK